MTPKADNSDETLPEDETEDAPATEEDPVVEEIKETGEPSGGNFA